MDEALRKRYHRLLVAVESSEAAFSPAQQRHLAVWKLWVFLRQQALFTDDSFIFTKVCRNLREVAENLPSVSSDEDAALEHVTVRSHLQMPCC